MNRKWINRGAAALAGVAATGLLGLGIAHAAAPAASASATNNGADASAAGVPNVITVSNSHVGDDGQSWSLLNVAGKRLVVNDGNPADNSTGIFTAANTLNGLTCSVYVPVDPHTGADACVLLLPSGAGAGGNEAGAAGSVAILRVSGAAAGHYVGAGADVLSSYANKENTGCLGNTEGAAALAYFGVQVDSTHVPLHSIGAEDVKHDNAAGC